MRVERHEYGPESRVFGIPVFGIIADAPGPCTLQEACLHVEREHSPLMRPPAGYHGLIYLELRGFADDGVAVETARNFYRRAADGAWRLAGAWVYDLPRPASADDWPELTDEDRFPFGGAAQGAA